MWNKNGCYDSRCRSGNAGSELLFSTDSYLQKEKKEKIIPLPSDFYQDEDVTRVAKKLLGCTLYTLIDGLLTGGMIVETEGYAGETDKACHAHGGKRTKRTEAMYLPGGFSYVYLCYGLHHLLNVVTGKKGVPHAVLIRAIEPLYGLSTILERRKMTKMERKLTAGPAMLTQALGITQKENQISFQSETLWIEEKTKEPKEIISSPRIGVAYAEEDALLPYRFRIKDSKWTSLAN